MNTLKKTETSSLLKSFVYRPLQRIEHISMDQNGLFYKFSMLLINFDRLISVKSAM